VDIVHSYGRGFIATRTLSRGRRPRNAIRVFGRLQGCLDERPQFVGRCVTPGGVLGIDQLVADHHLKGAAAAGDQGPGLDPGFEFLDQLCRDTHDLGGIVSRSAVFDADLWFRHSVCLLCAGAARAARCGNGWIEGRV